MVLSVIYLFGSRFFTCHCALCVCSSPFPLVPAVYRLNSPSISMVSLVINNVPTNVSLCMFRIIGKTKRNETKWKRMCRATPCRIFRLFLCRMPSHAALSLGARRKSSRLAGALVIFIYKKACQAQLIQAQERYEGNNGPCQGAARNGALQNCFN